MREARSVADAAMAGKWAWRRTTCSINSIEIV
jgi:hypothetical protein